MVDFKRKPGSRPNRILRPARIRPTSPSAKIVSAQQVIFADAPVSPGQSSSERALNRALEAWWQQGQLPPRDVLRDALLALKAGHPLDEPQRALLLRAALFYGRGMLTALRYQSDPERTASIMRDMLLHIQRPLNPAQIAYLVREDAASDQWFDPLLQLLREESSGVLEPRRTLAAAALLYLRQKPMVSANGWTPPSDLVVADRTVGQRALASRRRQPILRMVANVLAVLAIFLLTTAAILLWQDLSEQSALSAETRTIPGGVYLISAADDSRADRLVEVAAFAIDRTEVTNQAYRRCYEAGICSWPARATSINHPDYFTNPALNLYPMINVSWAQAKTYCEWAGKRLPLAEEWEIAAGSALTVQQRYLYPWGSNFDLQLANGAIEFGGDTQPVASYSPRGDSPAGVADMAGNVAEWTATPADPEAETPTRYLVKGGSFLSPNEDLLVSAAQIVNAEEQAPTLGFRCALTLPKE